MHICHTPYVIPVLRGAWYGMHMMRWQARCMFMLSKFQRQHKKKFFLHSNAGVNPLIVTLINSDNRRPSIPFNGRHQKAKKVEIEIERGSVSNSLGGPACFAPRVYNHFFDFVYIFYYEFPTFPFVVKCKIEHPIDTLPEIDRLQQVWYQFLWCCALLPSSMCRVCVSIQHHRLLCLFFRDSVIYSDYDWTRSSRACLPPTKDVTNP